MSGFWLILIFQFLIFFVVGRFCFEFGFFFVFGLFVFIWC